MVSRDCPEGVWIDSYIPHYRTKGQDFVDLARMRGPTTMIYLHSADLDRSAPCGGGFN